MGALDGKQTHSGEGRRLVSSPGNPSPPSGYTIRPVVRMGVASQMVEADDTALSWLIEPLFRAATSRWSLECDVLLLGDPARYFGLQARGSSAVNFIVPVSSGCPLTHEDYMAAARVLASRTHLALILATDRGWCCECGYVIRACGERGVPVLVVRFPGAPPADPSLPVADMGCVEDEDGGQQAASRIVLAIEQLGRASKPHTRSAPRPDPEV